MRWLVRHLLKPILFRQIVRAIDWTEQEKAQFDSFCRTQAGIRLFEFLRQLVANETFKAVYRDSVSANARARGMQDLLGVFHQLRVFPNQQEESELGLDEFPMPRPQPEKKNKSFFDPYGGGRGAISNRQK
jgi:hypothetical protein